MVARSGTVGGGLQSHEESGVLTTHRLQRGRRGVAFVLCSALLAIPLVLLHGDPEASADPAQGAATARPHPHRHGDGTGGPRSDASGADAAPAPETSPSPPTTGAAAPVAIAAAPVLDVTATTAPPVTTTTVATTTTTAPRPATSAAATGARRVGEVTYYDHPAGHCASPWLAFGTVVSITNPANGASVTCVVDDREADTARSIDLATASFAEIAPLSQGVVVADLRW